MRASHPNLLFALLIHELCVVVFFGTTVASIVFLETNCLEQKNVRTTVKWLLIVALEKISRLFFLRLLSYQPIGFLEFLSPKFNSNYYCGKENQNHSACQ